MVIVHLLLSLGPEAVLRPENDGGKDGSGGWVSPFGETTIGEGAMGSLYHSTGRRSTVRFRFVIVRWPVEIGTGIEYNFDFWLYTPNHLAAR